MNTPGIKDSPVSTQLRENVREAIRKAEAAGLSPEDARQIVVLVATAGEKKAEYCGGSHCSKGNPGTDLHPCPYKTEINDDHDTLCNCCTVCERECRHGV